MDLALLHSDQALYVYVRTHHIVSDAWGLQLFLSRVRAGYLGELGEPQAQMPTASLLAQLETDDYSGSEQYRGDRAYFAEALEGLEPALFTRRRPAGLRRTARHRLTLERALLDAIRAGDVEEADRLTRDHLRSSLASARARQDRASS